jgi:hypothetical protein
VCDFAASSSANATTLLASEVKGTAPADQLL